MPAKVIPIGTGGGLLVPKGERRREVRRLQRMAILAHPENREVALSFAEIPAAYVLSLKEVDSMIDRLQRIRKELSDEGGKNMAQALRKDVIG